MTIKEILTKLEALGNEKVRKHNAKYGAGDNQFGVSRGDLRKVAKEIKTNHELALELWKTGNVDARFVAILIMQPKALSAEEIDKLTRSVTFEQVADWFINYVIKKHPAAEELRLKWLQSDDRWAARAGWRLTSLRVAKKSDEINFSAMLDRIESEMPTVDPKVQWTMNFTLVEIGIHSPDHRERAINIGEKLGIYRDFPVSKGCTSPFAPIWIKEIVSRQN